MVEGYPPHGLGVVREGRRTASLRQGERWVKGSAPGSKIMQLRYQSKVYSLTVAADLASASDEPGQALL